MLKGFKSWVERVLEKPFYDAEIIRVEVLKDNRKNTLPLPKSLLKLKEIHH